uniref:M-phase inducer phosphatase n=1 Tax=Petromyzon marinus TaxID=7757 RepID=A0AAJ7WSI7_PETMA|nr:M-phase inducer phosphatase 2-like [Petromyzon marinus]
MAELTSAHPGDASPALPSVAGHLPRDFISLQYSHLTPSRQEDQEIVPLCSFSPDSWDSDSFLGFQSPLGLRAPRGRSSCRGEDVEEEVVVRRRRRKIDCATPTPVSGTESPLASLALLAQLTPLSHKLQDDVNKENCQVPLSMASLFTAPMVSPAAGVFHPPPPGSGGLQLWRGPRTPLSPLTPGDGSPTGCLKRPLQRASTAESLMQKRRRAIAPLLAPPSAPQSPSAPSLSPPPLKAPTGMWDHEAVQQALDACLDEEKMLGDFSRPCSLPTVSGKHQDLNYITQDTMAALLRGEFSDSVPRFLVLDCRYPYEFEGGHVRGALNLFREEQLVQQLLRGAPAPNSPASEQLVLVFYCEFSSERGPRQCQTLRRMDREVNSYPTLHYPEMYVLRGGYKDFFPHTPEMCNPSAYRPMRHQDFKDELRRFHSKSRSWAHTRPRSTAVALLTRLHTT